MIVHKFVENLLFKSFPKNKKLKIIDYGCGIGLLLDYLNIKTIDKYVGYDINADSIRLAKEKFARNDKISFISITKGRVPKLGSRIFVDAIILIGVLQYMSEEEVDTFLKEVKRVQKKNGVLIFTCATDHVIYKLFNIYKFFIPNKFINRKEIVNKLEDSGFKVILQKEKGLIIAPLFSNFVVFFFDALDKIFFQTKGQLGPIGSKLRLLADLIIEIEYKLPIDYGYTLFVKSQKK